MKPYLVVCSHLVGFFLCALCGLPSALAAAKPNIIVIMSDDAAYSDFGFTAAFHNISTKIKTPNLDALAQQSVFGSSFYTAHSLCSPTRAGLLTGQYSQRYGYEYNISNDVNSTEGLVGQQITMAQRLKPLGYTTGIVGKWHLGYTDGVNRPLDKGFDEFFGLLGGGRHFFQESAGIYGSLWKNNQPYETQWRQEGDTSRYDPVKGRYLTDAFGEEATDFVNRHAADENPFFLYVPLTGPHEPWEAKQSDLDLFLDVPDVNRRTIAAMTYAVDRAVGDVLGALQANGIDDNTIVVFTNDNGATSYIKNPPFRGHKGTAYEGGIRVPFLIKAPGLQPGVYNAPLTALDLLPTFLSAAGGDVTQFAHDGYDVMPLLKGEATDDPNKARFWRNFDSYAVRKGDWKLTRISPGYPSGPFLFNLANDPDENDYSNNARYPQKVAELTRELTYWEAQMAKPKWGGDDSTLSQNLFDHFVFRNDLAASTNWSTASAWLQGGTANIKTMSRADAYANGIFEFGVRNDADYTATNDMKRMTRETFMLNQMRLTGSFGGAANRQGTINGNAVLFVKSLNGELPQIRLDATSSGTPAGFTFQVSNELQLLHDLEITGDGTQQFVISGRIRDYYEPLQPNVTTPHNVRKMGTSTVTLTGNNTFAGELTIDGGRVLVSGPSAAIVGASRININNGGRLALDGGTIDVPQINVAPGGRLSLLSGTLRIHSVVGDLEGAGGVFSPGNSSSDGAISGNFTLDSGATLRVQLSNPGPGNPSGRLSIGGAATLGGMLLVQFANGFTPTSLQSFEFLTADEIQGGFSQFSLPALSNGLGWQLRYTTRSVALSVQPSANTLSIAPIGDYNLDGQVDSADYTVWRDSLGSTTALAADGNGDHLVNDVDYGIWKAHFGTVATLPGDFNGDGAVDAADYTVWRDTVGNSNLLFANGAGAHALTQDDYNAWKSNFGASTALPGDFNLDGAVDAADYSVWRDGLGSRFTMNDYNTWKANFGNTRGTAAGIGSAGGAAFSSSVPEPISMLLAALGVASGLILGLPRSRR